MAYPAPGMMVMTPVSAATPAGHNKWSTGATDACAEPGGCSRCCFTACCMPCAVGKVAASLPPDNGACCAGSEGGACVLHCIIGGSVYAAGVMFFGLLTPALIPVAGALTSCFHVSLRRGLKRHHGIEDGSGCCENDWVLAVCCDPCAVCQEQREIDLRRPQIMHPGGMMPPPMMMMNPMMMPPQPGQYMPPGQPAMRPMQPMAPQPYGQPGFAQGGMTPMPQAGVPVYQATVQPPQQPVAVAGYAPAYPTNPDKY